MAGRPSSYLLINGPVLVDAEDDFPLRRLIQLLLLEVNLQTFYNRMHGFLVFRSWSLFYLAFNAQRQDSQSFTCNKP